MNSSNNVQESPARPIDLLQTPTGAHSDLYRDSQPQLESQLQYPHPHPHPHSHNQPAPLRQDTSSSISTLQTSRSSLSTASSSLLSGMDSATNGSVYVSEPDSAGPVGMHSPSANNGSPVDNGSPSTMHHPNMFAVKHNDEDGTDASGMHRKASRRRTGPLTSQQRQKAAIIRKLGACPECRRRRVAVS